MANFKLQTQLEQLRNGTNVNSIDVPDELRNRWKTGMAFVDDLLEGGCVPTETIFFTGGPGTGKSTLFAQMADRITASGRTVLLNTGEESPYHMKMRCERLGLRHGFIIGQDTSLVKTLKHADECGADFLLVDSLQTFDDPQYERSRGIQYQNSKTVERVLQELANWAKCNMKVVFAIGHVNKGGGFEGRNTLQHMVDGHLDMWLDQRDKSDTYGYRVLSVKKHRFGASGTELILDMTSHGLKEANSMTSA